MVVKYHERKIGDKVFHYARTCETKEEANREAESFRKRGFKTRVFPVKTYFDNLFQVFTYPEDRSAFK